MCYNVSFRTEGVDRSQTVTHPDLQLPLLKRLFFCRCCQHPARRQKHQKHNIISGLNNCQYYLRVPY